jgi:hypothetical protein
VKLAHLIGFIIKKFVTMHGHMNVKFAVIQLTHSLCALIDINSCIFHFYIQTHDNWTKRTTDRVIPLKDTVNS